MENALIFGSGSTALRLLPQITRDYNPVGFLDNDENRWGMKIAELTVFAPETLNELHYDKIVIASLPGLYVIFNQLIDAGVSAEKIDKSYIEMSVRCREEFLFSLAEIQKVSKIISEP